jgi:preprotein translocase subunit SecA
MENDVPIEHPWVTKSIANAQKRVEGFHFDSRKQLIEYDDVMNQQRNTIYSLRRRVLNGHGMREMIFDLVEQAVVNMVTIHAPEKAAPSEWKLAQLEKEMEGLFGIQIDLSNFNGSQSDLMDLLYSNISEFYDNKEKALGIPTIRQIEHFIYLQVIDRRWKDHLQSMDHLREGIHFRGYAQKDPKQEYKKEGFIIFSNMMSGIRDEVLEKVFKVEIKQESSERAREEINALAEKQRIMAEKLKSRQILGRGQTGDESVKRSSKSPNKPGLANLRPEAAPPEVKLNRHQRRVMASHAQKDQKQGAAKAGSAGVGRKR